MSILESLQTKSKEDASKEVFALMNSKAIDVLSNMQEELIDESDLHQKWVAAKDKSDAKYLKNRPHLDNASAKDRYAKIVKRSMMSPAEKIKDSVSNSINNLVNKITK